MEEKEFGSRLLKSSGIPRIRLPTLFYNIQHFLLNEMLLSNGGCDCVTEKVFVFYQIHFLCSLFYRILHVLLIMLFLLLSLLLPLPFPLPLHHGDFCVLFVCAMQLFRFAIKFNYFLKPIVLQLGLLLSLYPTITITRNTLHIRVHLS